MGKDGLQKPGYEPNNATTSKLPRIAPGKVTRTSKLPSGTKPAVQRKAQAREHEVESAQVRSLWEHTMDPWMDAAHRGTRPPNDASQAASVQAEGHVETDKPKRMHHAAAMGFAESDQAADAVIQAKSADTRATAVPLDFSPSQLSELAQGEPVREGMSSESRKGAQPLREQASQPAQAASQLVIAPGKRTRTQGLPPHPAGTGAPVQRKPDPMADPARQAQRELTARGIDTAVRPDLYAPPVQRKEAGSGMMASASPADSGGKAIPEDVQEKMEKVFGADFSAVRIHEGPQATAMGALAYTQGTDIHFSPGQYNPGSQRGQELLGHELAHVVQQAQGRVQSTTQAKGVPVNDDAGLEREADELGARAARGESVAGAHGAGHGAARPETEREAGTCPTCGTASIGGSCRTCQARVQDGAIVQRQVACHGTNRAAGAEHEAIQYHYISSVDGTGVREYAIPGGSAAGNVGYADLISLGSGAIYEIKPYFPSEITSGLVQVAAYLAAAQQSCGANVPWHLGAAYPDSVIPFGNKELVAKQYGHPGLILYYMRNKRRQPQTEPVPVPQGVPETEREREINWERVGQVVLALGLSVLLIPVIVAALADPEPATKLALTGLSMVMIVTILDAFGMSEQAPQV